MVGISPRQYGEALRVKRLKAGLKQGGAVAPALYDAGYGSSSRLYEKAPAHLGMTLASYARGGRGAEIAFATAASPLGRLLVAATEKGVCMVALGDNDGALERALGDDCSTAKIVRDGGRLKGPLGAVLGYLSGKLPHLDLPLDVRATAFQWRVWECLRDIPKGQTRYYKDIAAVLGKPGAARAVGPGVRHQPGVAGYSLPSGDPGVGRFQNRLPLGQRAQAGNDRMGSGAAGSPRALAIRSTNPARRTWCKIQPVGRAPRAPHRPRRHRATKPRSR